MAYRKFHQEHYYEAPNYDPITVGLSNLFHGINQARVEKQRRVNQFDFDLSEGKFDNDQKILTEMANLVVNRGRTDIQTSGRTSGNTLKMMNEGKAYQQMSKNQFDRAKTLQQQILSLDTKDKYYDGKRDLDKLRLAVSGENGEVNFYTRGERLDELEQSIGGVDAFKYKDYRADYVKGIGNQFKEKTTGSPNKTNTIYDQATFWDNGKPGVTDQHAVDYLDSDPQGRVRAYFDSRMDQTLDSEIQSMKASGDARNNWMSDLSNAEIKNRLIDEPSLNTINSKQYGQRMMDMVKSDLKDADRINSKVSVEYKDTSNNGGLYKNDNIVHSYAFNAPMMQASPAGSGTFEPTSNPGPGGVLFQKNGKPISFNSNNPVRTNVNTGITSRQKIGNIPFNLTGYQLQAFKETGAPLAIKGATTDEMISSIKNLPLEYFDPNGKMKLQPEMKVGLTGYTINQANILNAANNQELSLQDQIANAQAAQEYDKVAALELSMSKIQNLKSLISSGIDDQELALAASRSGIKGIQVNEIIQASGADLANIRAITNGFDLTNPNYWNDDMRRVQEAYKSRANEAAASGYTSGKSKKKAKFPLAKGKPATVSQNGFTYTWNPDTGQYE